jgi:transcriptional regulator with XRE-family HTH domain
MSGNINSQDKSVIAIISAQQETLGITDHQLALAIGFKSASQIAAIMTGKVMLPVSKILSISTELLIDPATLLRTYLEQTAPTMLELIDALLIPPQLSVNELKLISAYRQLSRGNDVTPVIIDGCDIVALISV